MAKDATELVVASAGAVYVGPTSATLPTSPTASLSNDWTELGYVTEDGVALQVEPQIEEFMSWQSRQPVRRELTGQDITVTFSLQQWNSDSVILAFGGGSVTSSNGVYTYNFPGDDEAIDEKALCVEWSDGSRDWRAVFARGNVTDSVETNLTRSELAVLPITFKALEPAAGGAAAYIVTNDAAFTAAS
jgi:hypothetical protein